MRTWHRRLGHLNMQDIRALAKGSAVDIKINKQDGNDVENYEPITVVFATTVSTAIPPVPRCARRALHFL